MPPDERLSMAEQLSGTWDKMEANEPAPVIEAEPIAAEPVETAEAKAERQRDDGGRFAKEPREKLTLKPKEGKDAAPKQERTEEGKAAAEKGPPAAERGAPDSQRTDNANAGQPTAQVPIQPPAHWSGGGKVAWEKLPYPVKQALTAGVCPGRRPPARGIRDRALQAALPAGVRRH
jgi:hypothetical protein